MTLTGLHLLLTFRCTRECDHCFVWGSPQQRGTMSLRRIRNVLGQAREVGTIEWIYFEGGEPFLYHPLLVRAVSEAVDLGFRVGIVTNGYWALSVEDALEWLRPLAGKIEDLSLSSDLYHDDEEPSRWASTACAAAEMLGIPTDRITIAQPEACTAGDAKGQPPPGESNVVFRGRAATTLAERARHSPWTIFTECPHENLRDPGRVHVDPFGNLHICQGIVIGNLFEERLTDICAAYDPGLNPVITPLVEGGPAELARQYGKRHDAAYADACHLCYEVRTGLRRYFPEVLGPDQMYGNAEAV